MNQEIKKQARKHLLGQRTYTCRGRTDRGVSVTYSTPVFIIPASYQEPKTKGEGYWKTGFNNGRGFSVTLYTPSTFCITVGQFWNPKGNYKIASMAPKNWVGKTHNNSNLIYRRSECNWLSAHPTNKSATYWRSQARKVFEKFPQVETVEVVKTGRKTDSLILNRGQNKPAFYEYVIISSTGGRWGKSRKDFIPSDYPLICGK